MKKRNSVAENLGGAFAHIQSAFDDIIGGVFGKLSKVNKKEIPEDSSKIKKAVYATGGFLGDIGKSYYDKYEQIKSEKKDS